MKPPSPGTDREIRSFGIVMLVALGIFSALTFRRTHDLRAAGTLGAVGCVLALASWLVPRAVRPVYRAWMALGHAMGRVTTPIVVIAVFVTVFVPMRLVLLLLRRDVLARRIDRAAPTYWTDRQHPPFDRDGFERLY